MKTLLAALALLAALGASGVRAEPERPGILRDVSFDQRLGAQVPLDLPFRDESGARVTLRDYVRDKPVILVPAYYECPMLCTIVLNGVVSALRALPFDIGREFRVVTVSFNPHETSELAAAKKAGYLNEYRRPGAEAGWHFLVGDDTSIRPLMDAIGFRYTWDAAASQYAHASGLVVLTPEGRISHYFYGVEFPPKDLRLALVEASAERIGSVVDQILLFCFHYDPSTGRYGRVALNAVRAGGVLTLLRARALRLDLVAPRPPRRHRPPEASRHDRAVPHLPRAGVDAGAADRRAAVLPPRRHDVLRRPHRRHDPRVHDPLSSARSRRDPGGRRPWLAGPRDRVDRPATGDRHGDLRLEREPLRQIRRLPTTRSGDVVGKQLDVEAPAPRRRGARSTSCTSPGRRRPFKSHPDLRGRDPQLLRPRVPRQAGRRPGALHHHLVPGHQARAEIRPGRLEPGSGLPGAHSWARFFALPALPRRQSPGGHRRGVGWAARIMGLPDLRHPGGPLNLLQTEDAWAANAGMLALLAYAILFGQPWLVAFAALNSALIAWTHRHALTCRPQLRTWVTHIIQGGHA